MSHPGATLKELVSRPSPDAGEIAALLDRLPLADRIAAIRDLGGTRLQGALWSAVSASPRVSTDQMVPPDYPALRPVIFHGKNSLPAFTNFEKICFRPEESRSGDAHVAWGYNQTSILGIIGPGYYVLHDTPPGTLGGAAFDYTQIPAHGLPSWPPVRTNNSGISRLVYANMIDYMRRVASDVFIGSAVARDREMGSYFILVRELVGV
jgi:hypothetical protein